MIKKYELTNETIITANGKTLHRIRALIDIPLTNVKVGDLGGWVESEKNLSHEGTAWIFGNACVFDNAHVSNNACVSNNAHIYDDAHIYDYAYATDNARICGNARIYGKAWISGDSHISGDSYVFGKTRMSGESSYDGYNPSVNHSLENTLNKEDTFLFKTVEVGGKKYKASIDPNSHDNLLLEEIPEREFEFGDIVKNLKSNEYGIFSCYVREDECQILYQNKGLAYCNISDVKFVAEVAFIF